MTASAQTTRVSQDDVRHVASLANLELTAEELPRMARDLDAVLGYIDQLNEINTADVPAMAQAAEAVGFAETSRTPVAQHGESLRADQLKPSVDRTAVMAEAPETDGRFFKVPKVIER